MPSVRTALEIVAARREREVQTSERLPVDRRRCLMGERVAVELVLLAASGPQ